MCVCILFEPGEIDIEAERRQKLELRTIELDNALKRYKSQDYHLKQLEASKLFLSIRNCVIKTFYKLLKFVITLYSISLPG